MTLLAGFCAGAVMLAIASAQVRAGPEAESTAELKTKLEADYRQAVELFKAGNYREAREAFHAVARRGVQAGVTLSEKSQAGLRYYIGVGGEPGAVDKALGAQGEEAGKPEVTVEPEKPGGPRVSEPTFTTAEQILQEEDEARRARLARARMDADRRLGEAAALAADQKFQQAIEILETLKALAAVSDWPAEMKEEYQKKAEERLREVVEDEEKERLVRIKLTALEAKRISEAHAKTLAEQARVRREKLLEQAKLLGDEGQFDEALQILDALIAEDRSDLGAMRAHEGIERTGIQVDYNWIEIAKRYETRKTLWYAEEQTVPYVLPLMRYPKDWRELTELRRQLFLPPAVALSPADQAVINKMVTTRVTIDFVETPLSEVTQFLQSFGDFNIVIDKAGLDRVALMGEPLVTLRLSDVTIETALKFIAEPLGLEFGVKEGVAVISDKVGVRGTPYMVLYDIQDLLGAVPDYQPPSLDIDTGGGGGGYGDRGGGAGGFGGGGGRGGGFFGEGGEGEEEFVSAAQTGEQVTELIRRMVDPDSWDTVAGNTVEFRPPGQLLVVQTPEGHTKIRKLLDGLRQISAIQVSIDLRVVSLSDTYTQLVGADWSLTLRSDLGDDWFYTLGISGTNTGATGISGAGGINITGTFLGDSDVDIFLTAIQQNRMGHIMEAPRLTCLNGQRANVAVTTEIAYISDYDIEREVTGDPPVVITTVDIETEILEEGIVFDVRPVVSSDRRYVQLELRPSIALVKRPIAQFPTGFTEAGVPTGFVQLPERENTQIRTNVNVPDKGTLLIGGLNYSAEAQGEANVPVLGKLPLIKRLFSAAGQSRSRRNLIMLVRPEIIIQEEQERLRK